MLEKAKKKLEFFPACKSNYASSRPFFSGLSKNSCKFLMNHCESTGFMPIYRKKTVVFHNTQVKIPPFPLTLFTTDSFTKLSPASTICHYIIFVS